MANDPTGPGDASGNPPRGPAELQARVTGPDIIAADEQQLIAFFHRDAGRTLGDLADRTLRVGRRVEKLGLAHCQEEREALRELTRVTIQLLSIQFTDLDP